MEHFKEDHVALYRGRCEKRFGLFWKGCTGLGI